MNEQNKISVFGGSGFIGSKFCEMNSDSVIKIKRDEYCSPTNNILYFISTIDNYNVHSNLHIDIDTNLTVLMNVLERLPKNTDITFNFISSWFVYGECKLPAKEEYYCKPTGFYSITKKAAEDLLISFCRTYDVKYRILRLCNVMGDGDSKVSAKKNALSYMIDLLKRDEDVYLYDNGTPIRDIMHVDDVCRAIELVCREGKLNEIYNIGSGQPTPISTIIETAKSYLGSNSIIKSKEAPEFHKIVQAKDFWMDTNKLNSLGFTQEISNEQIIQQLCQ